MKLTSLENQRGNTFRRALLMLQEKGIPVLIDGPGIYRVGELKCSRQDVIHLAFLN